MRSYLLKHHSLASLVVRLQAYLHQLMVLDKELCIRVNRSSQRDGVKTLFRVVSRLGDGVFWYVLMAAILIYGGDEAVLPVVHMLSVGLIGTAIYKSLKRVTSRPRPYEVHQDIWLTGRPLDRFSFPSGHTLHAVIFTSLIAVYYPVLLFFVLPFTLLVALSRVVLGLHYPSDVLVGAILGYLLADFSLLIIQLFSV